jgi:hypothetical protein
MKPQSLLCGFIPVITNLTFEFIGKTRKTKEEVDYLFHKKTSLILNRVKDDHSNQQSY